jgi:hypothetical protein
MRPQPRWTPLLLCIVLPACSSAATAGGETVRRDPNVVTAEELADLTELSVFDALQRLRPSWVRSRGATSVMGGDGLPVVMVNNVTHDSIDILRQLRSAEVSVMRFVSGVDATTRFGTGYVNGLIEVTTH